MHSWKTTVAAPTTQLRRLFATVIICALTVPTTAVSASPSGSVVNESAHFKSLEGNLLGDSADRSFAVYLPLPTKRVKNATRSFICCTDLRSPIRRGSTIPTM